MKSKNPRGVYEKNPGSGIWYARWQDEYGEIKRQKVGSKSDAAVVAEQNRAKVRLRHVAPELLAKPTKEMMLADLLDHRLKTSGNDKSYSEEKRHTRDWKKWLPKQRVNEVTTADLEEWVAWRRKKVAPATVNRALAYLKTCYEVAVREGWAKKNPVMGIRFARENNKRTGFLELEDFFRMREIVDPEPFMLIELAILSSLRQASQFGLLKSQLDLKRKGLWLPDPKGGEKVWIKLSGRAVEILEYFCAKHPHSPFVWPGKRKGKPLNAKHFAESVLYPALATLGIEIGIKGLTWHSLRHTFASWLAEAGEDLAVIQELLIHSSQRTTERYRHLGKSRSSLAVEKLALMVTRGPSPAFVGDPQGDPEGESPRLKLVK